MITFTHIPLMKLRSLIYLAFICAFALSCKNDSTEPVDYNEYYPLKVGWYGIYDVREEIYSTSQKDPEIKVRQEKDEINDVKMNADGSSTYTFSRSTRATSSDYWQKVKEFTVQKFPDKLLTNIDNQTFFTLVFPIDNRINWNGNSYNNLDAQEYHYEDVGQSVTIAEQTFHNSLTVVERQDSSIINKYTGIKKYGLGVGLLSDEQIDFELCQSDECIGSGKVESGTKKTRKIVEFGGI
ncbi:hypothetical protein [Dyadobacter luticola]|uniref:Lipoprotein n=1 Tax=Dyadobacter luticola TaxID=1979387 RepID=A0A5R9KWQ4_9BACT|nr:hypothetical protein [Dyadobacter luticola]TLV00732.1 hypothetical protein FEN17_14720 [Dyadobacter luticola]